MKNKNEIIEALKQKALDYFTPSDAEEFSLWVHRELKKNIMRGFEPKMIKVLDLLPAGVVVKHNCPKRWTKSDSFFVRKFGKDLAVKCNGIWYPVRYFQLDKDVEFLVSRDKYKEAAMALTMLGEQGDV